MKQLITILLVVLMASTAWGDEPISGRVGGGTSNTGTASTGRKQTMNVDADGRQIGKAHVLDAMDAVTGWTALDNDTTGFGTDLDHVMGTLALEFDKVAGSDTSGGIGGIQKTLTSIDLSVLVENGGSIGYSLNASDIATAVAYCFLRLGTSASHYNEWRVDDSSLEPGWLSLRFNIASPSTAGATGNGWNPAAITYVALGCLFDAEGSTLADLRVDHLVAYTGQRTSTDVNAAVSSSPASGAAKVDLVKVLGTATDVDAGTSGLGTQRISVSTDDIVSISDDDNANAVTNPIYTQLSQDGTNAVDATHPVPISDDLAANAVTNPIAVQLSQDGTNAVDATHPVPISATLAANAVGNPLYSSVSATAAANTLANPMFTQLSQDGTNAVDATHPIPISDDLAANAVTNPIAVQLSQDGTNAMDATHPIAISATLAANAVGNPLYSAVSATAAANTLANPMFTQLSQDGTNAVDATHPIPISDDLAANALTNPLYTQLSQDGTNAMDATHPIAISATLAANAVGNPIFSAVSATAAANTLGNPMFNQLSLDGTNAVDDTHPLPVNVEEHFEIDYMNATTGWASANDAGTGLALISNHIVGTGSLQLDKVDGTAFTEAYIEKTLSSVDLVGWEAHNIVEWAVYISDLTDVEYTFLRLGDDNTNYSEWRVNVLDLTAGVWNPIAMSAGSAQYTIAGTGLDASDVDYVAVGVSFTLEDDLLNDLAFDSIHVHGTAHTTTTITADVTSTVNTANINVLKMGSQPVSMNSGNLGNGVQRVAIATNDVNLSAINTDTTTIAADTTSLDLKVTVEDLDTVGTDNRQVVGIVVPSAAGGVVVGGDANGLDVDLNLQTLTALKVSATAAANTLGNPMFIQISQDGTNAMAAATPLAVSATMAANATANRIWTTANIDQIGGAGLTLGQKASAASVPVVLASDDYLTVNLEEDVVIDAMDVDTGWASANDAGTGLAEISNSVEGVGSLQVDKVDGTGFTEAYLEKTLSSVVLAGFEAHTVIEWVVYLSDLTDVSYVFLRLGDDNANYAEWRVYDADLKAGVWNPISMAAGDVQYTDVGTGLNPADLDYVAVGASYDLEDDTLADMAFDDIHMHGAAHTTADVISSGSPHAEVIGVSTTAQSVVGIATDATADLVLGPVDISTAESWGIQINNLGGGTGADLIDADVQASRDNGATWTPLTWDACDALGPADAPCDYDFPGNSYTHVQVYTTANTTDTTVTVNLSFRE